MKTNKSGGPAMPRLPILLLDGNPAFLKLLTLILSDDYDVASFTDPLAATLWLEDGHHPALIISDTSPSVSATGLVSSHQFLKNLKISGFFRAIPHVLLSAADEIEDIVALLPFKVDAAFRKPFNPIKLKETIARILQPKPEYAAAA